MVLKNQKGFTLIELLVVVAIIGILAAIAIPQFAAYRNQAVCSRVESDTKNAMVVAEAWYAQNQVYPATPTAGGFTGTTGVTVAYSGLGTAASPLASIGTDTTGLCPSGTTYTITQGAAPLWS
jgi:type IV pilus assembly protein PilA